MGRRGPRAQDSKRYYDWLYKAEEDLHSARLLKSEEICQLCAAFHCQQCIEKALKAYILYQTNILHDGHNLTWLCKQAVKLDREFTEWLDESADLLVFPLDQIFAFFWAAPKGSAHSTPERQMKNEINLMVKKNKTKKSNGERIRHCSF